VTTRFRIHPLVEEDVAGVLAYTLDRFGLRQYHRYEQIIEEALTRLVEHPEIGRPLRSAVL
jgi:plasmid stabilization system protein ParE